MTVAAPRTMSPPANTPGMLVMPYSSAIRYPYSFTVSSGALPVSSGLALVPMATTTRSQSIVNSEPSILIGRRRPLLSGSPSSIFTHRRPVTHRFSSPMTSTGAVRKSNTTPSSIAWWTSSLRAGSSSAERR